MIVIFFDWDCRVNTNFISCEDLSEKVWIIICYVDDLPTDSHVATSNQNSDHFSVIVPIV